MKQLLAWGQLLRAGNSLTAASNVIVGFLISQGAWQPLGPLAALLVASLLLYEAGMVLNDAFDALEDAGERPERPIPSGRVSRQTAMGVGWSLLLAGVVSGGYAGWLMGHKLPGIIAVLLALSIVLYDASLKRTPLGPFAMGLCRTLNVLLGASVAARFGPAAWGFAGLVGLYTVGISFVARRENPNQGTRHSAVGEVFITTALVGLLLWPMALEEERFRLTPGAWFVAWLATLVGTGSVAWFVRREASAQSVRRRVTILLCGFILIDACAAAAVAGWGAGLVVLALWPPTWIAARFLPMT